MLDENIKEGIVQEEPTREEQMPLADLPLSEEQGPEGQMPFAE